MFKRKLCPKCKTGKYTYELDRRSPVCPYIGCYSGKKCPMYVKLEKPQKGGFWGRIFGNGKVIPPRKQVYNGILSHILHTLTLSKPIDFCGTKYGLQKDDDLLVYIDEIQATTLKNT